MQKVSYCIVNTGDGANSIVWFDSILTREQAEALEEHDIEYFGSGDGIQYYEMSFPDEFSVAGWAASNYITLNKYSEYVKGWEND